MASLRTWTAAGFICRQFLFLIAASVTESHLGNLPGVFADREHQQSGHHIHCDHDHGQVPTFSLPQNGSTISGHHGAPVQLSCAVHQLNHRAVSWIRKTSDDLQILTVGEASHTSDERIEAEFVYPHLWLLKINPSMANDSGTYLCHVSTDPPLIRYVNLSISVPEPIVQLVDGQGAPLEPNQVLYYRAGSSLELHCRVRHYWIKPQRFEWLRSGQPVADDLWRGGINIYTEATKPGQLRSKLSVANGTSKDGGNYTCALDGFFASVVVHLLKEEKQAASQHPTDHGGFMMNCATVTAFQDVSFILHPVLNLVSLSFILLFRS